MSRLPFRCQVDVPRWSGDVLVYLLVPVILLGLFLDRDDWTDLDLVARNYASLFATTLSIGLAHTLWYAVRIPALEERLRHPAWPLLYHAAAVVVSTRLGIELTAWLHALMYGRPMVSQVRGDLTPAAYVVSSLIILSMTLVTRAQLQRRDLERREEAARRESLRAQLAALQARTDPHFLFNSLNTVASLIEEDPRRAEEAVERLSSMFRYTLEGSRRDSVTLADELQMVRDYLSTESLRFGERLRHTVEVEPGLETSTLPPLVLQPLVENAVVHGVSRQRDGGTVQVTARRAGHQLLLTVQDDGPGADPGSRGSGGALRELAERLRLTHGEAASLSHGPVDPGYRAEVRLPLSNGGSS